MTPSPFRHPAFRHLPRDGLIRAYGPLHFSSKNIPGGAGGRPPVFRPTRKTTR